MPISPSTTCIHNFSNCHALFVFFLPHSVAVAAWSGIQRLDPTMIHFEFFFYQLVRSSQKPVQTPNNICLVYAAEKNIFLGIHPEKIIIPAPFHSKAFVTLYKSEMSWALLGRLSRGLFFAISGASNFKQRFMTLSGLGLLTMWELPQRVSYFVSSLL